MQPVNSLRPLRRYSVFDFEWVPGTLRMRLAGLFDGSEYRRFLTIDDFLQAILTRDNRGKWFFAHYGGMADVQFILEKLAPNPRYHLKAVFAGSSAIMVTVKDKRFGHRWIFVDSFCLLRARLSKVAEHLGEKKTGPTDDMSEYERVCWYEDVSLEELTEYNENDCRILYRAISEFEDRMLSLGGQLRITIASCALDLFLRKYLTHELPVNVSVNRWASEAYIASRVEVLQKHVKTCRYYDINSSFPYSGTFPLPGKIQKITNKIPTKKGTLYIADAEIEIPEQHIPPLPYRSEGRVFFPTGKWRARFFSADIECLEECGGVIKSVGDVIVFDEFGDDLARYFSDITALKQKSTGFEREQYKLLDNGLYGKFAERDEKQLLHVNPTLEVFNRLVSCSKCGEPDYCCACDNGTPKRGKMLRPGIWIENQNVDIDHAHVAISMAITSYSRRWLWQYMTRASECYYCDTDGLAVAPNDEFPTGDALGELKLEKTCVPGDGIDGAEFVQPKLYRMHTDKGKMIYKAKGFSLGSTDKERESNFNDLLNRREVQIRHMSRIRENFSRGCIVPWEEIRPKKILAENVEKRCFDKEGKSRPWSTQEIAAL